MIRNTLFNFTRLWWHIWHCASREMLLFVQCSITFSTLLWSMMSLPCYLYDIVLRWRLKNALILLLTGNILFCWLWWEEVFILFHLMMYLLLFDYSFVLLLTSVLLCWPVVHSIVDIRLDALMIFDTGSILKEVMESTTIVHCLLLYSDGEADVYCCCYIYLMCYRWCWYMMMRYVDARNIESILRRALPFVFCCWYLGMLLLLLAVVGNDAMLLVHIQLSVGIDMFCLVLWWKYCWCLLMTDWSINCYIYYIVVVKLRGDSVTTWWHWLCLPCYLQRNWSIMILFIRQKCLKFDTCLLMMKYSVLYSLLFGDDDDVTVLMRNDGNAVFLITCSVMTADCNDMICSVVVIQYNAICSVSIAMLLFLPVHSSQRLLRRLPAKCNVDVMIFWYNVINCWW